MSRNGAAKVAMPWQTNDTGLRGSEAPGAGQKHMRQIADKLGTDVPSLMVASRREVCLTVERSPAVSQLSLPNVRGLKSAGHVSLRWISHSRIACSKAVCTTLLRWRTWIGTSQPKETEPKRVRSNLPLGLTTTHFLARRWKTQLPSCLQRLIIRPWT